eukprot:TRINITY_DN1713_c0_g1_i1.p1 TRINITY_DN1713_c0_g1~~TRINITY_DN1713_c0_g1_i1.p1  ORF type:complete len:329 (+),score=162.42 TRINITY_DN1713_c0_g1_i1:63-1049(+)
MEQWAVDPHMEMAKRGWSMVKEAPDEDYVDVSGCQGIWKKVLEKGDDGAKRPKEGSFCEIEYWYRYKGEVFDTTDKEGFPLEIIPGSGMSTAGMEEGVSTMALGERATFTLDPLFAFKENGYPPSVPEWAVVELEMKLVGFMGPWTQEEKVVAAGEFKAAGNELFKAKEFKEGLKKYNKALDILGRRRRKPTFDHVQDPEKKARMLDVEERQHVTRVHVLQNIMQCWLKMGNMQRCLEYADNIIRQDPYNVKAHFRKAQHEASKHNYYTARDFLNVIQEHNQDPQVQKDVANELKRIAAIEAEMKRREKDVARKAFGGGEAGVAESAA